MVSKMYLGAAISVIAFLEEQHDEIKSLFTKVLRAHGAERERAFTELRLLMSLHETAEEDFVHPAAARALQNGEEMVAARLKEEADAKRALVELDRLDVASEAFETKLRRLESAVLAHVTHEEVDEFEKLGEVMDSKQLDHIGGAALAVAAVRERPGRRTATTKKLAATKAPPHTAHGSKH